MPDHDPFDGEAFRPWNGAPPAPPEGKPTYWRTRAEGAWEGLRVVGNGPYAFVSRCEGKVFLFATVEEVRAAKCAAGARCPGEKCRESGIVLKRPQQPTQRKPPRPNPRRQPIQKMKE